MTKRIRAGAPDGATHYCLQTGKYLKDNNQYILEWNSDRKKWSASFRKDTRGCIFIGKSHVGDIIASCVLIVVFVAVMVVW